MYVQYIHLDVYICICLLFHARYKGIQSEPVIRVSSKSHILFYINVCMYVLLYKFKLELYRYEYVNIYSYSSLPTQSKDLKEFPQCVAIKKNP